MADEHSSVPMWERVPAFPYFYHDLVGRVIPGGCSRCGIKESAPGNRSIPWVFDTTPHCVLEPKPMNIRSHNSKEGKDCAGLDVGCTWAVQNRRSFATQLHPTNCFYPLWCLSFVLSEARDRTKRAIPG